MNIIQFDVKIIQLDIILEIISWSQKCDYVKHIIIGNIPYRIKSHHIRNLS